MHTNFAKKTKNVEMGLANIGKTASGILSISKVPLCWKIFVGWRKEYGYDFNIIKYGYIFIYFTDNY